MNRQDDPVEHQVLSVTFDEEAITITWVVPHENDDLGGVMYQSILPDEGVKDDAEVAYWVAELKQSADELLAQWRRYRRNKK